ncbi:MAG: transposase [Spirochaetales bacterium]|nr:transposase [Spirochaetales bacterium]
MVSTLHVGQFRAKEVFLICESCTHTYRSDELCDLVPPGANFGYDVITYAGQALFLRYRNEEEVVAELAQKGIQISPRTVSMLGMKFIVYLAIAHQQRAPEITADMQSRGGYICHLDATCEGRDPLLMSSIDSLSEIVLGNVKLPAEDEKHIVPFLERIKKAFGAPLALVHDMGSGILKAVAEVFPDAPDFICHFHFLRDIGKDFLGVEYDTIRKRLRHHGISGKLHYRAKRLKTAMDEKPQSIEALEAGIKGAGMPTDAFELLPVVNAYTLIQWALRGKTEGHGYGFPFDRTYLVFAKRLRQLNADIERIKIIHLSGEWRDNDPYFKIHTALQPLMKDWALWKAVDALEEKIVVFEKLRKAMRIAPQSGRHGLNDEGKKGNIRTIEGRVKKFRVWLTRRKDYPKNSGVRKMIEQIDRYWEKLFADPIIVQTPSGPVLIQPQRTNNILEQFFRSLKRANRRRTGNASSSRMLRTMLAETPLVRNLENSHYTTILLNGKTSIEEVFAEIEIDTLRKEFRKAQDSPERIPAELKPLIAMPDFPEKLVNAVEKAAA